GYKSNKQSGGVPGGTGVALSGVGVTVAFRIYGGVGVRVTGTVAMILSTGKLEAAHKSSESWCSLSERTKYHRRSQSWRSCSSCSGKRSARQAGIPLGAYSPPKRRAGKGASPPSADT